MASKFGLWPLGLSALGSLLVWTGIFDPPGGLPQVVRDLLKGKAPTPGRPSTALQMLLGPVAGGGGGGGVAADPGMPGGAGGSARGAAIAAEALTYVGTPYMWSGRSRKSIDCSGLVLVCYRDVAGITMPHDATAQTRKGTLIPRDQAAAGDLVAWGSPARYPHITIAIDNQRVMGAWTYGVPAHVDKLDLKLRGLPGPFVFRVPT